MNIKRVKNRYTRTLMDMENVVACGVGYKETGGKKTDEMCIIVSVSRKVPEDQLYNVVPRTLDGVSTDVQERV